MNLTTKYSLFYLVTNSEIGFKKIVKLKPIVANVNY